MGAQRAHNRETTEENTAKAAIIQADLAGTGLPSQRFVSVWRNAGWRFCSLDTTSVKHSMAYCSFSLCQTEPRELANSLLTLQMQTDRFFE